MAYTAVTATFFSMILWASLVLCFPVLLRFLTAWGMLRANYLGNRIPISAGVLIPFMHVVVFSLITIEHYSGLFFIQFAAVLIIAYVGWKDDLAEGAETKGLKGHLLYFLQEKKVSTGLWKAIAGCGVALVISARFSTTLFTLILHFLLISLLTNLINLLDLRPGRALKGFFLLGLPLIFFSIEWIPYYLWLTVVIPAIFLFCYDVKGKVMIGDTGSNCLGFVLGFWMMLYAPTAGKVVVVGLALALHVYAEQKSLTELIGKTRFLHWLDSLGRQKENPE